MSDQNRLVLLPFHMPEKFLRALNHVLASRSLLRSPVKAQMLDRIFGCTAAGSNAGFLLQELGVTVRPQHLVYGRWHIIARKIEGMGPGDTLIRLRLRIVGQILRGAAKGFTRSMDFNDHR